MWTLIYSEPLPKPQGDAWLTVLHQLQPFTWLKIWELIIGDQTLRRFSYSRPFEHNWGME